jgi:hypothetical protein
VPNRDRLVGQRTHVGLSHGLADSLEHAVQVGAANVSLKSRYVWLMGRVDCVPFRDALGHPRVDLAGVLDRGSSGLIRTSIAVSSLIAVGVVRRKERLSPGASLDVDGLAAVFVRYPSVGSTNLGPAGSPRQQSR